MRLIHRDSGLRALYNLNDDMGKGRCTMLFSVVAQNVIAWMTGSLFYTSFLLHNGINLVNIGIITAIPLLSNVIAVFSPFILESFPRRRYLLFAGRITYYTLNLLCTFFSCSNICTSYINIIINSIQNSPLLHDKSLHIFK